MQEGPTHWHLPKGTLAALDFFPSSAHTIHVGYIQREYFSGGGDAR
jgi:hypothetical protein